MTTDEEMANNILATGAVAGTLMKLDIHVELIFDEKREATNELKVYFDFLKSPYRITVTRIPEE